MSYYNFNNDVVIKPNDLFSSTFIKANPYRNRKETIVPSTPQLTQEEIDGIDINKEFSRNDNEDPSILIDMGVGAVNIIPKFVDDIVSFTEDIAGTALLDDDLEWFDIPQLEEKTVAGEIVSELGSYVLAYMTGAKYLKKFKTAKKLLDSPNLSTKIMAGGGLGVGIDFIFSNPEDGNLSNLINRNPKLKNSVTEYLAIDGNDSVLEARMKNSIEGFILGSATESLFHTAGKLIKVYKNTRIDPLDVDDGINEVLGISGNDTAILKEIAKRQAKEASTESEKVVSTFIGSKNKELIDKVKADSKAFGEHVRLVQDNDSALEMVDSWVQKLDEGSLYDLDKMDYETALKMHEANTSAIQRSLHLENETNVKTLGWERAKQNSSDAIGKLITKVDGYLSKEELFEVANLQAKKVKNLDASVVLNGTLYKNTTDHLFKVTKDYFSDKTNSLKKAKVLVALEEASRAGAYLKEIKSEAGRALNASKINVDGINLNLKTLTNEDVAKSLDIQNALVDYLKGADIKNFDDLMKKVLLTKGDLRKMDKLVDKRGDLDKIVDLLIRSRYQNMLSSFSGRLFIDTASTMANYALLQGVIRPISKAILAQNNGVSTLKSINLAKHQFVESFKFLHSSLGEQLKVLRGNDKLIDGISNMRDKFEELDKLDAAKFGRNLDKINDEANFRNISLDNLRIFKMFRDINGVTDTMGGIMSKMHKKYDTFASAITAGYMKRSDQTFRFASRQADIKATIELEELIKGSDLLTIEATVQKKMNRLNELDKAIADNEILIPKEGDSDLLRLKEGSNVSALEVSYQQDLPDYLKPLEQFLYSDNTKIKILKALYLAFVKTPFNLIKQAVQFTPAVRNLSSTTRKALKGELGEGKRIEANVKMYVGSLTYFGAYMMAMNGLIRGKHREDEKDQLLARGVQEYSLNIGDRSYKFNRLDPLATMLGMTADLVTASQHMEEQELEKAVGALVFGFAENMTQKSWLQGIGELYQVQSDYERYGQQHIANQVRTFMPLSGLFGNTNRVFDNETRAMADTWDRAVTNVYYKQALPKRYNFFGEELDYKPDGLEGALMETVGIYTSKIHGDPLMHELTRLTSVPNYKAPPRIQSVKLTKDEKYGFMAYLKKVDARPRYTELINSALYKNSNDYERAKMVEKLERKLNAEAKKLFVADNPELSKDIALKRAYEEKKKQQKQIQGLLEDVQ